MENTKNAGRIAGILILAQIVGAMLANFVIIGPVFAAPGFLENAAVHPTRVALSVLTGLAAGALSIGIAITLFPVFRQLNHAVALLFLAFSVVGFSVTAVENISVMSLLSLSEAYTAANGTERDLFQSLRVVVASARNWAHFIGLIIAGSTLFVLYSGLLRYALVPRVLAAFGLVATILQVIAVSMPLFGNPVVFQMLMPLALSQLILAGWLIAKGFRGTMNPNATGIRVST